MKLGRDLYAEWLEADGLGGFASGTVSGVRTRRYHALLLTAATPPTGRRVLVNGFDAWVETPGGAFALTSQAYGPQTVHPDGAHRMESFTADPWPRWVFALEDGTKIRQELFVKHGFPFVAVKWKLMTKGKNSKLVLRPFISGRDYHGLHRENPHFNFDAAVKGNRVAWRPYEGLPGIETFSNGAYTHEPLWHRNFFYAQEHERGLDFREDLASPGVFRWDLSKNEAIWMAGVEKQTPRGFSEDISPEILHRDLATAEKKRRSRFPSRLFLSADSYVAKRGEGKTIMAGYPWFTDWGRDTFIALRGLLISTGRLEEARRILLEWSDTISEGMLPNFFTDHGKPEYNSVDASLWYVAAVHEFLREREKKKPALKKEELEKLRHAVCSVLSGYAQGARFGIRMEEDGLLSAGQPGVSLTWMDARAGDRAVTPRIGKPVEVEALWINALWVGSRTEPKWKRIYDRALISFNERFWNEESGCLYDVVDADHVPGKNDGSFRPNQIFAVGGLPTALVTGEKAKRIVDAVEKRLWTPMGLRSLAPGSPEYALHCRGGARERDEAYHQGTVWPWLLGAFVEAWLGVHGKTRENKTTARIKFVEPLFKHLNEAGIGHISEIADAEPPHTPRGCPFQAWSTGEVLRLATSVLEMEVSRR